MRGDDDVVWGGEKHARVRVDSVFSVKDRERVKGGCGEL